MVAVLLRMDARQHNMTHKVMIVTGGSRGIGAATAQIAAARGYAVCIGYRSNKQAAHAVADAILLAGGKAIAVAADVSVEADVLNLFHIADSELGRVSALVNNAGTLERQMRIEDMDAARINRVLATNVTGSFLCAREAVRRMSTKRGGSGGAIVNLSSAAARIGSPGEYLDYAASKGAIDTFTLGLAKEVADEGIRVNAVRPGIIDTEIHASGGEPGRLERLKSTIPMQRGGQADEVAQAIMWLLSDEASYTTGSLLDVTGGR
jgi:NAD(P)-dependent dehydrogenase (short-subunit alcohol dehydrogenase family)